MKTVGITAVRTGIVQSERLLTLADTLGIQLFQDLPVEYVPASRLQRFAAPATEQLDAALSRARLHPSARHFGLAQYVDTSDSTACAYFEQLAQRVRQSGVPGARTYYLSAFPYSDACAETVDVVLLGALNLEDPQQVLARWEVHHAGVPAGIGSVGMWVRSDTSRGLRVPHSPEAQARFLETTLRALLVDTAGVAPYAVFVHRWKDVRADAPTPERDLDDPYLRRYGLIAADGFPRPAFDVVRGIYTGRQTVFAFDAGGPVPEETPWLTLIGWGIMLMLGIYYALSPRFRHMVPRYFRAHNFYQDAVREGRDVLLGASVVLLVALGLSAGIVTQVFLDVVRREEPFVVLFRWTPEGLQEAGLALLAQPWMLITLVGAIYALGLVLWAALLGAFSRRRYALAGGQALMLVTWPRWPLLLVMAAALVVTTYASVSPVLFVLGLVGAFALVTLYALLRTLYDYTSVTRVPVYLSVLLFVLSPFVLLAVVVLVLVLQAWPETTFLWHLATRS